MLSEISLASFELIVVISAIGMGVAFRYSNLFDWLVEQVLLQGVAGSVGCSHSHAILVISTSN